MIARRTAPLVAALLLVTGGLASCGDDDGGEDDTAGTTTTAAAGGDDGSTTEAADTTAPDDAGTTVPDDETTTTTDGGATDSSTTSPDLPPDDSPLAELLLDPAAVGPEYAPDDTLGDGSLDTDLCDEVTLEETWDDQAAQALLAGTGEDAAIFQQAILRFPDDAAAETFLASLSDALVACQPGTETVDVDGIGDEAVLATAPDAEATTVAGLVRVGDLVGWHLGISGPGVDSPVTEDLISVSADQLAA